MSWFKNLWIYRLNTPEALSPEQLQTALSPMRYTPCGSQDSVKSGWVPPLKTGELLTHSANGHILLCLQQEEKILPASVINQALQTKMATIEAAQQRKLKKSEKTALKEEVIMDLLPRAFSRFRKTALWIDTLHKLIIIDSGSVKRAEEALALLRKCLGTLPVTPLTMTPPIEVTLTEWVRSAALPAGLQLQEEAELKALSQEGSIIRCKQQPLLCEEIAQHIASGKQVTRVAIQWQEQIQFLLCDDGSLKRLRYSDTLKEKNNDIIMEESALARFDADFALVTGELQALIQVLILNLGGNTE